MKIASFNVQRFGESKVSKPDVLSTLVKIVSRYDIILILEVVDKSEESVKKLLTKLNKFCKTRQIQYKSQLSARLGRSTYKEQFLFLYRDYVELTHSYQYKDNKADNPDVFAREPYILHFKPRNTVLEDIVLIPVHTTPEDSKNELNALHAVSMVVRKKWNTDVCGFISGVLSKKMKKISIRTDKKFHWLIGDDVDTTVITTNDHTYDRIVVYGDVMTDGIEPDSAKPFNFHLFIACTFLLKALEVSDHYPVEVELRRRSPPQEAQK
uniref:Deoxyribonuclease n=1 Tax=Neogobius melanostomus TaxID=47308 RepID=A0A8C6SJ17_9GOBI